MEVTAEELKIYLNRPALGRLTSEQKIIRFEPGDSKGGLILSAVKLKRDPHMLLLETFINSPDSSSSGLLYFHKVILQITRAPT